MPGQGMKPFKSFLTSLFCFAGRQKANVPLQWIEANTGLERKPGWAYYPGWILAMAKKPERAD